MGDVIGGEPLVVKRPGRHSCWGYSDDDEFRRDAQAFLRDGIQAGERAVIVQEGATPDTSGFPALSLAGDDFYGRPAFRDLAGCEARWRALIEEALSEGYAGVRIVSDGTRLVAEAEVADLVAWELRMGRLVSEYPLRVVCGFGSGDIDKNKVADLVCVHTSLRGTIPVPLATFHLGADTLTLQGELDVTTSHLLEVALAQTEGDVTVDMTGIDFMDLRSIQRLRRFSETADDRNIRMEGVPDIVTRAWGLLEGSW